MEKVMPWKWKPPPKAGVPIFISDKMDFKPKTVTEEKDHCIMTDVSLRHKDMTFVNMHPT